MAESKGGMGGEKIAAAVVVSAAVARGFGENKPPCLGDVLGCAQVTPPNGNVATALLFAVLTLDFGDRKRDGFGSAVNIKPPRRILVAGMDACSLGPAL